MFFAIQENMKMKMKMNIKVYERMVKNRTLGSCEAFWLAEEMNNYLYLCEFLLNFCRNFWQKDFSANHYLPRQG